MSETKFTPGPWIIKTYINYRGFSIWSEKEESCVAERWSDHDGMPIESNAHLISAAPDLYESILILHPKPDVWRTPNDEECRFIEVAIAKARGEK